MARTNNAIKIAEPVKTTLAIQLLNKAADHMLDRAKQYDSPEGEPSALLWTAQPRAGFRLSAR